MPQRKVSCASRRPHPNPHEGVTRLGGPGWGPLTRVHVVTLIEAHVHTFVVLNGGRRAELYVVREQGKPPYLRGWVDGAWDDILLELPRCPSKAEMEDRRRSAG